jgi:hypothetical protein
MIKAAEELGNGIRVIDSGYLGSDIAAIYLLRQNDEVSII